MNRGMIAAALVAAMAWFDTGSAAEYDLVVRNGRVLDGAGNPWVLADIAISDGRFVKVGRVEGEGRTEIDARGKYVSPGWIDMMDQSGRVLLKNGLAHNKVRMGVTTVIAGEGGTPVPAEEIGGYFAQLETQGISVNFGTYYSATQARVAVMGDGAGAPDKAQLAAMADKVDTAMRAGVFGITTALIYPPSSFHSTAELVDLAKVVARHGGIYASHMRDEGKSLVAAVQEAIEIGEKSGAKVEIFHLKAAYEPGWGKLMREAGATVDAARARGVDVAADLYPYRAGGTGLEATVPSWVFADGFEKAVERLTDPALRARLKREVEEGSTADWSSLVEAAGGWDNVVLANAHNPKWEKYHFKSIADIAAAEGRHPADMAWDIVLDGLPNRAVALFFMMSEEDIATALRFPWTSIGSDASAAAVEGGIDDLGLPHPRSYGTFPRIIAEYVKKRNVLTLPEAIRKMTSWPAARMGLFDRGMIREGLAADLVIFDLDRIADKADWERPLEFPQGIETVLVNGAVVVADGRHTGAKPGRVLRGPGFQAAE